jgi:purine nucleosidase
MRLVPLTIVLLTLCFCESTGSALSAADPVSIIFDTDMGNDVDDTLALGMLHALEQRGACRLLAVTVTKDHPLAGPFVDAVNTFYGRGDLPVGVVRHGPTRELGKYLALIQAQDNGQERYPHHLRDGNDAPDAVSLLRQILVREPDHSVMFVQVGFSTNLVRLLASPGDAVSPLTGIELVTRKSKGLAIMAGAFESINGNDHYLEYNVTNDIPALQTLVKDWPTEIIWSGFEIGIAVPYPATSIEQDYNYVPHHPLAEAYRLYEPPPHNRPTWDLTAALYAVAPDRGYFELSPQGTVTVENDGFTRFTAAQGGRHRYLIVRPEQRARLVEAMVQLSSQPPSR